MSVFSKSTLLGLAATLIVANQAAVAADQSELWLERMNEAVEFLNYEGTLVYMRPGLSEMFRVYHRVEGRAVTERVVEMDGGGAEIIRTTDEVICIFPAQRSIVVDRRAPKERKGNPLQENLPEYSASLASYYQLELLESERIVDRLTAVIAITPRDEFRYGYRLWLDHDTAMPLKSQLLAADTDMPVEEIRFSSIEMPELVAQGMVESEQDTTGFTLTRHGGASTPTGKQEAISWRSANLPPGFMQTAAMHEYIDGAAEPRVHIVYSDGLASVSVFVDMGVAASEQAEGMSMIGAANAYSVMKQGMLVTAMGEVPSRTAQQIALSMTNEAE